MSTFGPCGGGVNHCLEAPWDRLDVQDRKTLEVYSEEMEHLLSSCGDGTTFVERAAQLDRRFTEAFFAQEFGSASADPVQAFRHLPTGGIVHKGSASPSRVPSSGVVSSSLGAQASEIHNRFISFLDDRFIAGISSGSRRLPQNDRSVDAMQVSAPTSWPSACQRSSHPSWQGRGPMPTTSGAMPSTSNITRAEMQARYFATAGFAEPDRSLRSVAPPAALFNSR
eukprot:TRINITY_DN6555_c2_g1_i1.p1 TRINITY_DN6555_c2_g1~~TRINITY_DN6555_c2_g1_i1.p1  ORF type:complete len:243 (-),score=40.17 TRINITY_DN6555_c2_g1_i1:110-784(-)